MWKNGDPMQQTCSRGQAAGAYLDRENRVMVSVVDQENVTRADSILINIDTDRAALIDQAMTRSERNLAFQFGPAEESNDFGGGLHNACTMC